MNSEARLADDSVLRNLPLTDVSGKSYQVTSVRSEGELGVVLEALELRRWRDTLAKPRKQKDLFLIKVLFPTEELAPSTEIRELLDRRFLDEIEFDRQTQSDQTSPVLSHGTIRCSDSHWNGRPFRVSRLVAGRLLSEIIAKGKRKDPHDAETPPLSERLRWMWTTINALRFILERGYLRTEFFPTTVLLTTEGKILIGDFGGLGWDAESANYSDDRLNPARVPSVLQPMESVTDKELANALLDLEVVLNSLSLLSTASRAVMRDNSESYVNRDFIGNISLPSLSRLRHDGSANIINEQWMASIEKVFRETEADLLYFIEFSQQTERMTTENQRRVLQQRDAWLAGETLIHSDDAAININDEYYDQSFCDEAFRVWLYQDADWIMSEQDIGSVMDPEDFLLHQRVRERTRCPRCGSCVMEVLNGSIYREMEKYYFVCYGLPGEPCGHIFSRPYPMS